MNLSVRNALFVLGALIVIGVGTAVFLQKNAGNGGKSGSTSSISGSVFENASSTLGDGGVVEPAAQQTWDTTWMRVRKVGFTPPPGYWVYDSELRGELSLVPGKPPLPESPDPADEVQAKRVASFISVTRDATSFPTWERFQLTMAQFQCASGTTDEDFIVCLDKPKNVMSGKTQAGLPYEKYSLDAVRKIDQAPRGLRTFVMVRLGAANDSGVLITVLDEASGAAPALQLAKSMRIQESPSAQ